MKKIFRQPAAHVVYQQLQLSFSMVEVGGSAPQQYNTTTGQWEPNRRLTPLTLLPSLELHDPDGYLPDGDYASQLAGVVWATVAGDTTTAIGNDDDYQIDPDTHALVVSKNVPVLQNVRLRFTGLFLDTRTRKVHRFSWEKDLTCNPSRDYALSLHVYPPQLIELSPLHDHGQIELEAQLHNGPAPVPDSLCVTKWQVLDGAAWRDIDGEDVWCVSGWGTRKIVVEQRMIEELSLRCVGYPSDPGLSDEQRENLTQTGTVALRRMFGHYDFATRWVTGATIFPETTAATLKLFVSTREGEIADPARHFFWYLAYATGTTEAFTPATYLDTLTLPRRLFGNEQVRPAVGDFTELSALLPLRVGGMELTLLGRLLLAKAPLYSD